MSDFHGPEASATLYEEHEQQDIELSASETRAVADKLASFSKFFGEKVSARYKIEVQFGKARSTWKPFHGAMSLYLSGTKLNGGGDEKLYLCPGDGCTGTIMPIERFVEETPSGKAIARVPCPMCQIMWPENALIGELFFNLTAKNWAEAIHKMFVRLDHNADIYLKYHREDIRYLAALEVAKSAGGEEIAKARTNRGLHIYPLKNLIKDTGAGAQLYDRFLAFINA
jgi:hypothetical protein